MMRFLRRAEERKPEFEAGPAMDREIEREVLGIEPAGEVPHYSTHDATAVALATRFSRERGWWHFEKREVYGGWSVGWIEESQPLLVSIQPIRASATDTGPRDLPLASEGHPGAQRPPGRRRPAPRSPRAAAGLSRLPLSLEDGGRSRRSDRPQSPSNRPR